MNFKKQKPIYLQIADTMSVRILEGEWGGDERIPSVRDVAAELGVNPNTVLRTYEYLQTAEIIYNRRGVGYFVSPKAVQRIQKMHQQDFLDNELPYFKQRMKMLGLSWEDVVKEGGV